MGTLRWSLLGGLLIMVEMIFRSKNYTENLMDEKRLS